MQRLKAIGGSGLTAIMLAWSGNALAQLANIELVEVSLAARTPQASLARASATMDALKQSNNSALRMATRASRTSRAQDHLNARASTATRSSGASASARCQSEVAEHRQERRGAKAAGRSGPGGKGPNPG